MRWAAISGYIILPLFLIAASKFLPPLMPYIWTIKKFNIPIAFQGKFLIPLISFIILAIVVSAQNVIYIIITRRFEKREVGAKTIIYLRWFANVQIALDLVVTTYVVHLIGGIDGPGVLFYFFHIVTAATLLSPLESYFQVTFGVILFTALVHLEYSGVIPHIRVYQYSFANYLYKSNDFIIGITICLAASLYTMVFLITFLSNELRTYQENLKARVLELHAFYNTSKMISSTFAIDKVFANLMKKVSKTLNLDKYCLLLLNKETKRLYIEVASGFSPEEMEEFQSHVQEGIPGKALTSKKIQIALVNGKNLAEPTDESKNSYNLISIPLKVKDIALGVFNAYKITDKEFSEVEIQSLSSIGSNLALNMINTELYREVERLSITDGLTNLYNYRYFMDQLEREIKRADRYRHNLSLIMLDVDYFKHYNDTYGHLKGDSILKEIGRLLSESVRETDTAARYGGEEFAIILPEIEDDDVLFTAERIRKKVEENPFPDENTQPEGKLTISLGVAYFPLHAQNSWDLINKADMALYQAKGDGRNNVVLYDGRWL